MQFKQRLVACYKQECSNNVRESPRCDTYKHFKTILEPEKYLSTKIELKIRKIANYVYYIMNRTL